MASRAHPPRPHPLTRVGLIDRSNAGLRRAWDKGWLPEPTLDPDELWAAASKSFGDQAAEYERAGRDSHEVADFRDRLIRLTDSANREADLNPVGRAMAHGQLVRMLRHRLRFGKLWSERPELLETKLAAPIIVIGHMRSGTTRIHRLLAADPAHSSTRFCDSWHPVPSWPDMRTFWGGLSLAIARKINPWIDAIHPMASGRVEEELGWLAGTLNHATYETQWRIPSYTAFSESADSSAVYSEFARILRTDAAHRSNAAKPRVLKVPQFSEDLPTLLAQFPDARLVVASREDEAVVRSTVSLVANQMTIQSDSADLDWIEAEWRRKLALRSDRMRTTIAQWQGPIAHLHFDALGNDWESEIERTYAALEIPLSQSAKDCMHKEMAGTDASHHHVHADQMAGFAREPAE